MSLAAQKELTEDPRLLYRISTDGYHSMLELGELAEGAPFELLDGYIVRKIRSAREEDSMTINPGHAAAVRRLTALNGRLAGTNCFVQTQQPISLPPFDEPEPDGAIIRGAIEDYDVRHPGPQDVLCVIEVADASLKRDRGYKRELYARVGIPMYLIVNLLDRVIEVYKRPARGKGRYASPLVLSARQSVTITLTRTKSLKVQAQQLLP